MVNTVLEDAIQKRYDLAGPRVVEELKKRQFEAYYVKEEKDLPKKLLELIPKTDSISWGGSMTLDSLGIKNVLKDNGYNLIDRNTAKTPEEASKLMKDALTCDTFLMSSNAITEDGQLFNIDGNGNRVAALIYGPKSVIVIAGMNKVVKDMNEAYNRVRHFTAPINAQRFNLNTPCCQSGECANCLSPSTICAQMVATRFCKPANRIKVILVGSQLGM